MNTIAKLSALALGAAAMLPGCNVVGVAVPSVPSMPVLEPVGVAVPYAPSMPVLESVETSTAFAQKWSDKSHAEGKWIGEWEAIGAAPGAAKFISAQCMEIGPGEWIAKFDAVCDAEYTFKVEMNGREAEGGTILFQGVADLGEYGVYHWSGEVTEEQFVGRYKSGNYEGGFTMTKVNEPEPIDLAYCPTPAEVAAAAAATIKN